MVDAQSELCLERGETNGTDGDYQYTKSPQCARAVVAALAPLLLKKLAIQALALPAVTVLKWRTMPHGVLAQLQFWRNNINSHDQHFKTGIALDNVMAQIMTWLDLAIVFGPQIPLLVPLILMAVAGQRWSMQVGLERLERHETRWNKSAPAVWSVVLSLVAQQALNVWLYQGSEMVSSETRRDEEGTGDNVTAAAVRRVAWAGGPTACPTAP